MSETEQDFSSYSEFSSQEEWGERLEPIGASTSPEDENVSFKENTSLQENLVSSQGNSFSLNENCSLEKNLSFKEICPILEKNQSFRRKNPSFSIEKKTFLKENYSALKENFSDKKSLKENRKLLKKNHTFKENQNLTNNTLIDNYTTINQSLKEKQSLNKELPETPNNHTVEILKEKLKTIEEEQEVLNSALFSLTTHLAQVQLRLRQILSSPVEDRDVLLMSLEEFASHGIPDVKLIREKKDETGLAEGVKKCRETQKTYIKLLRKDLQELEHQLYLLEHTEVCQEIINMKSKLNKQYNHFLTSHKHEKNIRFQKRKDCFVQQLKTHISDLENFISYLKQRLHSIDDSKKKPNKENNILLGFLHDFLYVAQIFFNVDIKFSRHKNKKIMESIPSNLHWGNLRAILEMSISNLCKLMEIKVHRIGTYMSDSDSPVICGNVDVILAIRRDLAVNLLDLMGHGIKARDKSFNLITSCITKESLNEPNFHPWEFILKYYELNVIQTKLIPIKKLSQSFNLNIRGTRDLTEQERMLTIIEEIFTECNRFGRNYTIQFKNFICAGLNLQKLAEWLSLLYSCIRLVKLFYHPWSYAVQTGFGDCIKSLKILSEYKFDLPVDAYKCAGAKDSEDAFFS